MVKLKRTLNRRTKERTWYKYRLYIPEAYLQKLGWDQEEMELDVEVWDGKIILREPEPSEGE